MHKKTDKPKGKIFQGLKTEKCKKIIYIIERDKKNKSVRQSKRDKKIK